MNPELGANDSDFLHCREVPPRFLAGRAPSGPGATITAPMSMPVGWWWSLRGDCAKPT